MIRKNLRDMGTMGVVMALGLKDALESEIHTKRNKIAKKTPGNRRYPSTKEIRLLRNRRQHKLGRRNQRR